MNVENIIFFLIVIFMSSGLSEHGPCEEFFNGCCPGTMWDSENDRCVDCKLGHFWANCSKICPYPAFGRKCRQHCTCKKEFCNFMIGCPKDTRTTNMKHTNQNKTYIMLVIITSVVFVLVSTGYITVWIIDRRKKAAAR